jgi:hypothetical protein
MAKRPTAYKAGEEVAGMDLSLHGEEAYRL